MVPLRCKCHGLDYFTCPICGHRYCALYWTAFYRGDNRCPRCDGDRARRLRREAADRDNRPEKEQPCL